MITKKKIFRTMATVAASAMLLMPFASAATAAEKKLNSGETWEVTETTALTGLTIAEGAAIKAPEGRSITLTVDGVETPIKPGAYKGAIVLTPAENIVIEFAGMGASTKYNYRAAVNVENGKYLAGKSVPAAVVGGKVTDTSATDVKITSVNENFNGIIVRSENKTSYSISNPVIDFTGNGGNDFAGFGAGIMSSGKAEVTIDKAKIVTRGAVRTAIFVGGDSIIHVNDADIDVYNGTLPAGYKFSVAPGEMMEVPWMLGIVGNARATNLTDNGIAYYVNSHIRAEGWGCLSSDNVANTPKLYADNCLIETTESGYGAFSLGTTLCTFKKCTFNVKDMALISQDGDSVFTDGTVVNSDRLGVMYWGSDAYLTIDKGSVFNTKSTLIQVKGGSTHIVVDNAKLNPGNGILLQMMANDDPNKMSGGGGPGGGGAGGPAGGGMPGGAPQGGAPQGGAPAGGSAPAGGGAPGGGGMPGGGAPGASANASKDVDAVFSNMTLAGDMVNGNTAAGGLAVSLKNVTLTGAISSTTIKHALGPNGEKIDMNHPELYRLIGEVTNTYCATDDKFGVTVSLDGKSVWTVDKTSYLTGLTIADGAAIKAPQGFKVTLTVDGASKEIKTGSYKGKIVLTVTKA